MTRKPAPNQAAKRNVPADVLERAALLAKLPPKLRRLWQREPTPVLASIVQSFAGQAVRIGDRRSPARLQGAAPRSALSPEQAAELDREMGVHSRELRGHVVEVDGPNLRLGVLRRPSAARRPVLANMSAPDVCAALDRAMGLDGPANGVEHDGPIMRLGVRTKRGSGAVSRGVEALRRLARSGAFD